MYKYINASRSSFVPAITDRGYDIWFRGRSLTSGISCKISLCPAGLPICHTSGGEGCGSRSPCLTGRAAIRACPVVVNLWASLAKRH